jgi:hypothetical protein
MKMTTETEFGVLSAALELVKRPNFKCGSGINKKNCAAWENSRKKKYGSETS